MVKLISAILLLLPAIVNAAVLFEDNFDNSPDWASQQTVATSDGGFDITFNQTYQATCTTMCPPQNWSSYRCASSAWSGDRERDTFILSSGGSRNPGGKGITYNIENKGVPGAADHYGGWAGGGLYLWLGESGHPEVWVRMWIKYTDEWKWTDPANYFFGLQKLARISVYNEDLATTTNEPDQYGGTGAHRPVFYPDLAYNYGNSTLKFFCSTRKAPTLLTDGDTTFPTNILGSMSGWHLYEFRVVMNSTLDAADGIYEVWFDNTKVASRTDVKWKETGSGPNNWNFIVLLDNANISQYMATDPHETAINMDDVVISTARMPAGYIIGSPSIYTAKHSTGTAKHLSGTGKLVQ